jgi:hypothetical protein
MPREPCILRFMPPQALVSRRRAHLVLALGALAGGLLFLADNLAHASAPRASTPPDSGLRLLRSLPHQRGLWPD